MLHALGRERGPELAVRECLVEKVRRDAARKHRARRSRNASQIACPSSITVMSMRPQSGSLLPASAVAIPFDSGGTGPDGTYVVSR